MSFWHHFSNNPFGKPSRFWAKFIKSYQFKICPSKNFIQCTTCKRRLNRKWSKDKYAGIIYIETNMRIKNSTHTNRKQWPQLQHTSINKSPLLSGNINEIVIHCFCPYVFYKLLSTMAKIGCQCGDSIAQVYFY